MERVLILIASAVIVAAIFLAAFSLPQYVLPFIERFPTAPKIVFLLPVIVVGVQAIRRNRRPDQ